MRKEGHFYCLILILCWQSLMHFRQLYSQLDWVSIAWKCIELAVYTQGNSSVLQIVYAKGQLNSRCPLVVIVWTKIATKTFDKFLPQHLKSHQINKGTLLHQIPHDQYKKVSLFFRFDHSLGARAEICQIFSLIFWKI